MENNFVAPRIYKTGTKLRAEKVYWETKVGWLHANLEALHTTISRHISLGHANPETHPTFTEYFGADLNHLQAEAARITGKTTASYVINAHLSELGKGYSETDQAIELINRLHYFWIELDDFITSNEIDFNEKADRQALLVGVQGLIKYFVELRAFLINIGYEENLIDHLLVKLRFYLTTTLSDIPQMEWRQEVQLGIHSWLQSKGYPNEFRAKYFSAEEIMAMVYAIDFGDSPAGLISAENTVTWEKDIQRLSIWINLRRKWAIDRGLVEEDVLLDQAGKRINPLLKQLRDLRSEKRVLQSIKSKLRFIKQSESLTDKNLRQVNLNKLLSAVETLRYHWQQYPELCSVGLNEALQLLKKIQALGLHSGDVRVDIIEEATTAELLADYVYILLSS